MDDLDAVTQPCCPNDGVVMRDVAGGYRCSECGRVERVGPVTLPSEFDGPAFPGY